MPDNLKLSKATHMAFVPLDIHLEIPDVNHTFHSALPLHDLCKLFVVPLPGDWPTWYYTKQKIVQLAK